jgi:hypothetical protein
MLNREPQLKLLRKNNYFTNKRTNALIYPTLNNKLANNNKNIISVNINQLTKRKVNSKKK